MTDQQYSRKLERMLATYDKWLYAEQNGKTVEQYLCQKNFYNIAIYGYGMLGKHLFFNLLNSRVCVEYVIDKNAERVFLLNEKEVYTIDDYLPDVDAIIVTLGDWEIARKVKSELEKKFLNKVILFSEMIHMM